MNPKKLFKLWKQINKGVRRMNWLKTRLFKTHQEIVLTIRTPIPELHGTKGLIKLHDFIAERDLQEIEAIITEEETKKIMEE